MSTSHIHENITPYDHTIKHRVVLIAPCFVLSYLILPRKYHTLNQIMIPFFHQIWHKKCFKCAVCSMTLTMKNYKGYEKKPYCSPWVCLQCSCMLRIRLRIIVHPEFGIYILPYLYAVIGILVHTTHTIRRQIFNPGLVQNGTLFQIWDVLPDSS